ncbi:MAG: ATPase, T2SS/T4P/T4SS family [Armatimonadota bacterium]
MLLDRNKLFGMMVEKQISHLHLVPGSPVIIRQRTVFVPLDNSILKPQDINEFIDELLTDEQKKILKEEKEIEFSYSMPGMSRFRINIFMQRGTYAAVIFMNPLKIPTIDDLLLPEFVKEQILKIRQGLIVVTGTEGSGKSLTLAAIINHILENRSCQMISLEDPIEFLFKNKKGIICQREIGTDVSSYEKAFETISRLNADVYIFNKVNSYTTAKMIAELSSGGSLVLVAAQAPSSVVFIEEFIDFYPPHLQHQAKTLLSIGLELVISQTLCTKATGDSMMPVFEILLGIPQVKTMIKDGKFAQIQNIMGTQGRDFGMQTQEQALRALVKKNVITQEEAESKAVRLEEFKKLMALPY